MAKQSGILPLRGTIDNLSFFKGANGGYHVRKKNTIDKSRILTDDSFARTRENMSEFSIAAKGSKLLREALSSLTNRIGDKTASKRLSGAMFKVLKADKLSPRGHRNLMDGDISMLKGFQFSEIGTVSTTFTSGYTAVIDRVAGTLGISIPEFVPANSLFSSEGSTHYQLHAIGAELDFTVGTGVVNIQSTPPLPINGTPVPQMTLNAQVTPNSTKPLVLLFAIELWLETNGQFYPLKNKVYNGMVIAEASKA